MRKKQYLVCDEYDHSRPFNTRTEAVRECAIWRKEGRNAEVIRRMPKHLAARPAAIIPHFYERSAEQVFNHSQPIEVRGDVEDAGPAARWYERSLDDWDAPVYEQPRLRGWLEREPELEREDVCAKCGHTRWTALHVQPWGSLGHVFELAMSPQEIWMEHRGWSA